MSTSRGLLVTILLIALSAFLGMIGTIVAQYFSNKTSDLYAVVYSYPHYHVFDWDNEEIRTQISDVTRFEGARNVGGVYNILLKNKGTTLAQNVRAYSNGAIGIMMSQNNKKTYQTGENLRIGNIGPSEEVEMIFWINKWQHSSNMLQNAPVQITYDNGIVEIDFWGQIDGYSSFVYKFLDKYLGTIFLWMLAISVLMAVVGVVAEKMKPKKSPNHGESP